MTWPDHGPVGLGTARLVGLEQIIRSRSDEPRAVRRPPGLFDLDVVVAGDGGLARPGAPGFSLSAADLVSLVRQAGAGDCDIRILAEPGEQNLSTLRAVAHRLGRDVLIAPNGARLIRISPDRLSTMDWSDAEAGDERGDVVMPVDAVTGLPVDWLTIQPDGQIGAAFGWFELVGGRVVPRSGLVALPLPDGGRAFATRDTFVSTRAAAARLRPGHPGLVTVRVDTRDGGFALGHYDNRTMVVGGAGLASALSSVPLYQANLRLWLTWPPDAADRRRLSENLVELADVTGATVWAPVEAGGVTMLDGCLDLAAVGPDGHPRRWQAYGRPGPFESDEDGRLVPAGGVRIARLPGVPLVSGHPGRERELAGRPQPPTASGLACDLAVLADGRLAVRYADESLLAVGGRQFCVLLRGAGWRSGDVILLSPVTPEQAAGTRRHLAELAADLGAAIILAGDADPDVGGPGRSPAHPLARLDQPGLSYSRPAVSQALRELDPTDPAQAVSLRDLAGAVADHVVGQRDLAEADTDRPRHLNHLRGLARRIEGLLLAGPGDPGTADDRSTAGTPHIAGDQPAAGDRPGTGTQPTTRDRSDDADQPANEDRRTIPPDPTGEGDERPVGAEPADDEPPAFDESEDVFGRRAGGRSRFIDGPRLTVAAPQPRAGLDWLPPTPQTNAEDFDVYVSCEPDPDTALVDGVPGSALFLVGHLDRDRLSRLTGAAHLLQIRVAPGGAVDLAASEVVPPPGIGPDLDHSDAYLLPAGWLDRCRVIGVHRIADGRPASHRTLPTPVPLLLTTTGADHGVPGLPVEAVRWPKSRLRAGTIRYVVIDGEPGGWRPLHTNRPDPLPGAWLLAVAVGRGAAIDVVATAAILRDLPAVRSSVERLATDGVEALLPAAAYRTTVIRRAWRGEPGMWREFNVPAGQRLSTLISG